MTMEENVKRKTLLYIALTDLKDKSDGVAQKVINQSRAFYNNGYDVDVIAYANDAVGLYQRNDFDMVKSVSGTHRFRQRTLFNYARELCGMQYDTVYIRFPKVTPYMISALSAHHKAGAKVVVEFASYPLQWHKPTSFKVWASQRYYRFFDHILGGRLHHVADKALVIGQKVDKAYGITATNIPNGAELSKIPLRVPSEPGNELHIVFSASFYMYQGADRLIEGIAEYEKHRTDDDIRVYAELLGDGPEYARYQRLVEENGLQELVRFHGFLSGNDYDEIFDCCQMAAGAMAPHRADIPTGSALKIKDYMARGIPFFYCYEEIGLPEDYPYGLRLVSEDTPMDIPRLIEFYNTYKDKQEDIAPDMREYVMSHFSWEEILKDV
ncbi:MAG: hypothetical protein HUJ71_10395 [Pseudobutyrivibrio sp.]|nr:hypothetical protein [Pseudobutyrivibrio sp.]